MSESKVIELYRYPIKGMTAEPLEQTELEAGGTMPFDRAYAIENGPGRFDPDNPRHLPKINFVMLMRNERLASLSAQFEDETRTLTIRRAGKQLTRGNLETSIGRQLIEQFLSAYLRDDLRGAPKIVSAPNHSFSDVAVKCLHVVNLASVRELERVAGRSIDPLRFRANVYIDGIAPFSEIEWIGRELRMGAISTEVIDRTVRCEATNVDPQSAARDMAIPALLQRTWGRSDFGIYCKVTHGGRLRRGDPVVIAA